MELDDEEPNHKQRKSDQRPIRFDGTISIGALLTLGTLVFGGIWAMSANNAKLDMVNEKITDVKSSVTDLSRSVDRQVVRLDNKIDAERDARR